MGMREADECTNSTLERSNTDCLIIRTKALTESGAQFFKNGRRIKKLGSGKDLYSPPIHVAPFWSSVNFHPFPLLCHVRAFGVNG